MIKFFTELHLGNFLVIRDPATGFTNILIFLAGLYGYNRVKRSTEMHNRQWGNFFLLIGLSSLIGVIVHSFSYYTPSRIHFWIWIAMGLIQNAGITFAQIATAKQYFPRQVGLVSILAIFQFVCLGGLYIYLESYEAVKAHIAIGLLPVMIWNFYKGATGNKASGRIGGGILISGISGLVHSLKISISPWFNYNDIAHLFIAFSLLVIASGVMMQSETASANISAKTA